MPQTMIRRATLFVMAVTLLTLAMGGVAVAHSGAENYVYLDVFDSTIEGEIHLPVADVNEVLGTDIPEGSDAAVAWAEENSSILFDYSREHLSMTGIDGSEWELEYTGFDGLDARDDTYIIMVFNVDREFAESPRQFIMTYDAIIHAKPERSALLAIATDFGSGTFNNESDMLLQFSPSRTTQTVDLGDTSFLAGLSGVIFLGMDHIRIGMDHILFILALVLPSVLVFGSQGWRPAESFRSSFWRVLKIVTMFTVAHTITLTLGGLGIVELPPALVETVIAISIILAALHNLRPVFQNREWLIAFSFGLIHGFGFAGLLADLGLTQSRRVVSLLGFNIGIEIGQAVIILLVFPALFMARRTKAYLPLMRGGSLVLIAIAAVWAIERAFGIDLYTEWVFARAIKWPRQLIPVALLYIWAYWVYRRDREAPALASAG